MEERNDNSASGQAPEPAVQGGEPGRVVPPAVGRCEIVAYIAVPAALLFLLLTHTVAGLVAGLIVSTVLHRTSRLLHGPRLSSGLAKALAVGLLVTLATSVAVTAVWGVFAFARGHLGDLPGLYRALAEDLDKTREELTSIGLTTDILDGLLTADQVKEASTGWLRKHGAEISRAGGQAGRLALHGLMGIVAAILILFRKPSDSPRPLAAALVGRVGRFAEAFERILLAQFWISAVNTCLTALYLFGLLPLLGQRLPLSGTLVAVTFLAGLLPVVGNLISNTVIVLVSFGVTPWVALVSLGFLVAIHKLEYLVNAKIVGSQIGAQAWELFLAIVLAEVAFGVPGMVIAPSFYAWAKGELVERGLV
jgi:predicted PurR-regulated permease PerM